MITFDIVVRAEKAELTGVESAIAFWKLTAGTWGPISNRVPWPISCRRSPYQLVGVATLPVPDEIIDAEHFLFLPALSRLTFAFGDTLQVWAAT